MVRKDEALEGSFVGDQKAFPIFGAEIEREAEGGDGGVNALFRGPAIPSSERRPHRGQTGISQTRQCLSIPMEVPGWVKREAIARKSDGPQERMQFADIRDDALDAVRLPGVYDCGIGLRCQLAGVNIAPESVIG